jgi:hypothetical protein
VLHADLTCDAQTFTDADLNQELLSLACLLGDMSTIGSARCTLTYISPTSPTTRATLASVASLNEITGSVTFEDFLPADNAVEDAGNNGASTCAMAEAVPGPLP